MTLKPVLTEQTSTRELANPQDLIEQGAQIEQRPEQHRLSRWRLHLLVLGLFMALTIVVTWPMFPQLGGFLMDKGDPLYSAWAMTWQAHALVTDPSNFFNANIMYPFHGTLTFNELVFAEAMLAAPIYWLSGNPILAHNVILFATFVLSGYGMWLLVRKLTGNGWAGLVAGSAFAFSFYRLNHLPHTTIEGAQWLPLILFAGYRVLDTRAWRWVVTLAILFTVQALSSHYLAFYAAILMTLFFSYYMLVDRRYLSWQMLGKLVVAMAGSLVVMLPILLPYANFQSSFGFGRDVFEVERFSNTLASFLAVYRGNPIYLGLLAPFADPGPWAKDRSAFPGLVVPLLALLGVICLLRAGRTRRTNEQAAIRRTAAGARLRTHAFFYTIVALLSALLSLGPTLQVSYASSVYDPNAVHGLMPLPYALLYAWVPGFQSMRVAARIDVLTTLSLCVLAGIGAFFIVKWAGSRRAAARWTVPVVAALLALLPILETWSAPLTMAPVATRGAVPQVYRWLATQPHTVILEYPMVYYQPGQASVEMQNLYQYYSTYHWDDLVNGITTIRPYAYSAVVHETEDCFPCPRSLDTLRALGVRYVVAHMDNLSGPQKTDFLWRSTNPAGAVLSDFVLVKDFGADKVYEIENRPDPQTIASLIPDGASILLGDPANDPRMVSNGQVFIGGGYMAALAYYLRDHPEYGDALLSMGQSIRPQDPGNRPDYALLWARQDPATAGYKAQDRIWSNEFVALYKHGPGIARAKPSPAGSQEPRK